MFAGMSCYNASATLAGIDEIMATIEQWNRVAAVLTMGECKHEGFFFMSS